MKIRNGFVSNSSNSSFIILSMDGSEYIEGGRDLSASDILVMGDSFGVYYSYDDIQDRVIEYVKKKEKEGELEYDPDIYGENFEEIMLCLSDQTGTDELPDEISPLNNLEIPTHYCLFNYLIHESGKTKEQLLKEMKDKYGTYKNFLNETGMKI